MADRTVRGLLATNPELMEEFSRSIREDREAEIAGQLVYRIPVKYLRQAARLKIFCEGCSRATPALIAAVIKADGRLLLVVRERGGGFYPSTWLDGTFWGDVAVCKQGMEYNLDIREVRAMVESGTKEFRVSHDDSHITVC